MKLKTEERKTLRGVKIENLNVAMGMMFSVVVCWRFPSQSFELDADSERRIKQTCKKPSTENPFDDV